MMHQCKNEKKFRHSEIRNAKDALSRSLQARGKCRRSLRDSLKNLPELKASLKTYQKELKRATEQREKEHKIFLEKQADYTEAVKFLAGFIEYVKEKFHGKFKAFSFVEYSENLLKHASKLDRLGEAMPALVALAQHMPKHNHYTYTPANEAANNLKEALHNLLRTLKTDLHTLREVERKAQEAFVKYRTYLLGCINVLEKNIQITERQIVKMKRCIRKENVIIKMASAKIARNTRLLHSAGKMCKNFAREFVRATLNRLAEIKCIQELLVIIKKRFGQLPKDLVRYLETVKDGWIKYVNSTEFHAFKVYRQKHIKDSAHARKLLSKKNRLKFF